MSFTSSYLEVRGHSSAAVSTAQHSIVLVLFRRGGALRKEKKVEWKTRKEEEEGKREGARAAVLQLCHVSHLAAPLR